MCDESVLVNTAIDVSSRDVATDLTINTHYEYYSYQLHVCNTSTVHVQCTGLLKQ